MNKVDYSFFSSESKNLLSSNFNKTNIAVLFRLLLTQENQVTLNEIIC